MSTFAVPVLTRRERPPSFNDPWGWEESEWASIWDRALTAAPLFTETTRSQTIATLSSVLKSVWTNDALSSQMYAASPFAAMALPMPAPTFWRRILLRLRGAIGKED